jgi:hypothetical protein
MREVLAELTLDPPERRIKDPLPQKEDEEHARV